MSDPLSAKPADPAAMVDEVRVLVQGLLQMRPGTLRMCDALVKVATELAEKVAGPASPAAWLERAAGDVRRGARTQAR